MSSTAPPETGDYDIARGSMAGASWTLVSRVSGFARIAVIAAVLGPTYLGNTFQATNLFPNIVFYLLTGSLFANLLVPPLMRHLDGGDRARAERMARGFLGIVMPVLLAVMALVILLGPLLLRLFASGVSDPAVAADQRRVGLLLLVLLMPQVPLYGIAFTGAAVMNAHGRFALANAAPTLENLGMIATFGAFAVIYGVGQDLGSVTTAQLVLLGVGTTASVAVHASAEWWGARRCGVTLVPRFAWSDPDVRDLVRRAVPSLGYAVLNAIKDLALLVMANRVAGGVVGLQVAYSFYNLAVAIGARTVATAALPQLSRLVHQGRLAKVREELVRSTALALFLTIPAAVAFAVLARPIAEGVSFGEMATSTGFRLVAAGLAAMAVGVVADAVFTVATAGSYALHDLRAPLSGMAVRTGVSLAVMMGAFATDNPVTVVAVLGAAVSVGNVLGCGPLLAALRRQLPSGKGRAWAPAWRAAAASAVMVVPALACARLLSSVASISGGRQVVLAAAAAVGGAAYLLVSCGLRSPELADFGAALPLRSH